MSYSKFQIAAVTLIASFWLAPGSLLGQGKLGPLAGAAERIAAVERQLDGENDYQGKLDNYDRES